MVLHAPVLRYGWLSWLARPLDGGRRYRGRRIFGDNKTWRGAIVMFSGVVVTTLILARVDAWWTRLPLEVQAAPSGWLAGSAQARCSPSYPTAS